MQEVQISHTLYMGDLDGSCISPCPLHKEQQHLLMSMQQQVTA
ncbi:hypothetical protein OIU79_028297 [Salix purpurea]|uniref:Uncharacterized protein n=1 Tax=Salix purpurea TaxID=77065 RepID=A0A9Q0VWY2_SALPP|nr:hypothetical protein OIU79_028297 [Salix purpurea]